MAVACVYGESVVGQRPDGLLDLEFSSLEAAAGMLAGFGGSLEVVSPEALRQKLGAIGQELLATYVDPAPPRSYEGQEEP